MTTLDVEQVKEGKVAEKGSKSRNLVKYLKDTLDKGFNDTLEVTHIYGSYYRVNWVKPVKSDSLIQTFRRYKSRFLYVTDLGHEVVIEDHTK